MDFHHALLRANIDEATVGEILGVAYARSPAHPGQDAANFFAAALAK